MKARNIVIGCLLVFGLILFGLVQGVYLPQIERNKQQYELDQQDPLTHDIESVLKYKNKFMGNASNLINLFYSLPLNRVEHSYQLYPDTLTVDINYTEDDTSIDQELLYRALIYNATAAFALIDNLEVVNFKFTNNSYKLSRSDVESWYGVPVLTLTDQAVWANTVQDKLSDPEYVRSCAKAILQKSTITEN